MNDCVITSRSSDTTNTGMKGGVCILLEKEIGRQLLNLACHYHVTEIMLEKVFGICDVSKSPNMDFFGHFKDFLPRVNQALFTTAMEDDSMAAMIASWKDNVIEFVTAKLEKYQPRDNYRDLLELSIYIPGWRSCMRNLLPISWSHSPCSLDDHGHVFQ